MISNKYKALDLVLSGSFGNRLRFWKTYEDIIQDGYTGKVSIRTLIGGNGKCKYACSLDQIEPIIKSWDLPKEFVYFNEDAPDHRIVLQGEYLNTLVTYNGQLRDGVFLYSTLKTKMRTALHTLSNTVYGYYAKDLIRQHMTASSWSDFEVLLDQYPDHVLEVSIYDICLGDIKGRNSLVWEVRRY